jgi:phage shock protein PspC (stress-responsive transcriptional regulator)
MSESVRPHLRRGRDRWLGGVCSGLAGYFNVDPLFIRIAFVAAAFLQGFGILLYVVLWVLMPPPDGPAAAMTDFRAHFRAMSEDVRHLARGFSSGPSSPASPDAPSAGGTPPPPPPGPHPYGRRGGIVIGVVLIVLGAWFLLQNLGWLEWWRWDVFWPALFILLGVALLVRRFR